MLKNESVRNRSEPKQPERSLRCDSGAANGLKNRCRMRMIFRSVCFPKQLNFF